MDQTRIQITNETQVTQKTGGNTQIQEVQQNLAHEESELLT